MAFVGMDIGQVDALGRKLQGQAQQLDAAIRAIEGLVQQSQGVWKGADASQFAGWWQQQHKPALMAARDAINGLGQSAINNAKDQQGVTSR